MPWGRWLALGFCVALGLALGACGGRSQPHVAVQGQGASDAKIVQPASALQCVPYARELSDIQIRGDAWTWWRQAEGRYAKNTIPRVGSVLVLSKSHKISGGHLAVVTDILSHREVVVSHANWLNRGRIHLNTPVYDISPGNDWSLVRVWYTPGDTYGAGHYPAHGFIHPSRNLAAVF